MRSLPFLLKPVEKDYLWGGRRLRERYGKKGATETVAETWECSTHPHGLTSIASGPLLGMTLQQALQEQPQWLGTDVLSKVGDSGMLPILVKFIDAAKDLSIQVHPHDDYAAIHENGQKGKTEWWYVLEAEEKAQLVYGFHRTITAEELRQRIADGTIEQCLRYMPVKADEVYPVPAGTVHAIGAGSIIVEIQECSDLTYRLYDYNRRNANGALRPLHVDKALAVAKTDESMPVRQPLRTLKFYRGYAMELLWRCPYFQVERMLWNTETEEQEVFLSQLSESFQVFICIKGEGCLTGPDFVLPFTKGQTVFMPAGEERFQLEGFGQLLKVRC